MTGDARMPTTGSHLGNVAFNYSVGFLVATGLQASRIALKFASRRADRRLVRAEERAARHERKAQAWDEFGCDLWDWEP